jgi:hypothetical protein
MSRMRRNPRTRKRTLPAALALALLLVAIASPPPATGCGMAMDPAPSGSVAAPDCCTDRSCPRMALDLPRPQATITTISPLVLPLSAVAVVGLSPAAIAPPVPFPSRIFRDRLLGPPLRI